MLTKYNKIMVKFLTIPFKSLVSLGNCERYFWNNINLKNIYKFMNLQNEKHKDVKLPSENFYFSKVYSKVIVLFIVL